jgi:rhamnogalacturonan endolyase
MVQNTYLSQGMFGDFVQDDVVVRTGEATHVSVTWTPESAGGPVFYVLRIIVPILCIHSGRELWRRGVPDKSAGEFRNGNERDERRPDRPTSAFALPHLLIQMNEI